MTFEHLLLCCCWLHASMQDFFAGGGEEGAVTSPSPGKNSGNDDETCGQVAL